MKKKAMKVSKIAKGKRAKSSVFRGSKEKTVGGLTKANLVKNKGGRVVSKKASQASKKAWAGRPRRAKPCTRRRRRSTRREPGRRQARWKTAHACVFLLPKSTGSLRSSCKSVNRRAL